MLPYGGRQCDLWRRIIDVPEVSACGPCSNHGRSTARTIFELWREITHMSDK